MGDWLHFFRHKWTKWSAPQSAEITLLGKEIEAIIQQRTCETCGQLQTRMV